MLQPSSSVSSSSSSLLMELLKTCLCHVGSLLFALCNWLYTDKISLYISKTSSSTSWWCFDYKICLNRSKTSSSTSWWCFDVWSLAALPSPCRKFASPQIPLDYSSPFTPLWWGQGGITCGAIDEPKKSSKAIDERVIINFRDKNVVIARFCDKNVYR